jgi:hypothetical protein
VCWRGGCDGRRDRAGRLPGPSVGRLGPSGGRETTPSNALTDGSMSSLVSVVLRPWSGRGLRLPEDLVRSEGKDVALTGRADLRDGGAVPSRRPPRGLPHCAAGASLASSAAVPAEVAPTAHHGRAGPGRRDGTGHTSSVAQGPRGSSRPNERAAHRPTGCHASPGADWRSKPCPVQIRAPFWARPA